MEAFLLAFFAFISGLIIGAMLAAGFTLWALVQADKEKKGKL